jgi:hypothetical protein
MNLLLLNGLILPKVSEMLVGVTLAAESKFCLFQYSRPSSSGPGVRQRLWWIAPPQLGERMLKGLKTKIDEALTDGDFDTM